MGQTGWWNLRSPRASEMVCTSFLTSLLSLNCLLWFRARSSWWSLPPRASKTNKRAHTAVRLRACISFFCEWGQRARWRSEGSRGMAKGSWDPESYFHASWGADVWIMLPHPTAYCDSNARCIWLYMHMSVRFVYFLTEMQPALEYNLSCEVFSFTQSFTLSNPVTVLSFPTHLISCLLSRFFSSFLRLPLSDLGGPLSSCPKPAHFSCLPLCSILKACHSPFGAPLE